MSHVHDCSLPHKTSWNSTKPKQRRFSILCLLYKNLKTDLITLCNTEYNTRIQECISTKAKVEAKVQCLTDLD